METVRRCVCTKHRPRGCPPEVAGLPGALLGKPGAPFFPVRVPSVGSCVFTVDSASGRETEPHRPPMGDAPALGTGNCGLGHVRCRGPCRRPAVLPTSTRCLLCPHPLLAGPRPPRGLAPGRVSWRLLFISGVLDTRSPGTAPRPPGVCPGEECPTGWGWAARADRVPAVPAQVSGAAGDAAAPGT